MIVVDPGDHARLVAASGSKENSNGPASLLKQLEGSGVGPSEITHVVVTHLHFDHYAGVTRYQGGGYSPSFPNAEYIIPAKDWDMPDISEGRKKRDRDLAETLGVLQERGLLTLQDGGRELAGDVAVEPAPGESPGHQLVALGPESERGYIIGDLFHQREEVEHPELMATWTDRGALASTREAFSARASRESAVILSGHMPPGRIKLERDGVTWTELDYHG